MRIFLLCTGLLTLSLAAVGRANEASPLPLSTAEGGSRVVSVATGENHICGLRGDGAIVCWGENASGQAPAAIKPGPYLAVTAGWRHSCGLKSDGSAECWGAEGYGQDQGQSWDQQGPFTALTSTNSSNCGLKPDGSAQCWGSNYEGKLGTDTDRAGPYLALASGLSHVCGLRPDGAVHCWGANDLGQYGSESQQAGPYVQVVAGGNHTCALTVTGVAVCWGWNSNGQINVPGDASPFISLAAGRWHTCGLTADGQAECWGASGSTTFDNETPLIAVAAGDYHSCSIEVNGRLSCPKRTYSNDPNPDRNLEIIPDSLAGPGVGRIGQIAAGNAHACQVRRDGTLGCWGDNTDGQATAPASLFAQVVAGDSHSCAIDTNGEVTCWGLAAAANNAFFGSKTYRQLAVGSSGRSCAMRVDVMQSECASWGTNPVTFGLNHPNISHTGQKLCLVNTDNAREAQCYDNPSANSITPSPPVPGPWLRVEAGLNHACGLKMDGTLQCWGDGAQDQTTNVPTGNFRTLSVGYNHACAIKADGQLACWGSNVSGQATPPAGTDTYVQVAAGNTFTCAIRSDGVRVCWGDDAHGQAPQLALSPGSIADGDIDVVHAGVTFSISDAGTNADGDYVPPTPVFYADPADLPPGLSLSAAGVLSGTPTALGSFTFTVEGEDANGFVATRTYTVVIADPTPPSISYTLNDVAEPGTPDGANGWYISDVALAWTVTDAESAASIDNGCVDTTVATDTAPAGVTHACATTSAGGSASASVTIKRDATAPTASLTASPAANANGWHNADVTILATCSDATPGSGIASCPSVANVTAEGSTNIPAQQVSDNAGNTANSNSLAIQLDKTAPSIVAAATSGPDGNNGWYVSPVTVAFTCNDATSGVASCPTNQVLATDGNPVSSTAGTATDNAGNTSAPSNVVTVKIDQTAPTLDPSVPDPILRGQSYVASSNATDATSGIASSSCGALDTSSLGEKTTSCSATDNAGNTASADLSYTVTTTCSNDGYSGTQLSWCRNVCEKGYTGAVLNSWIHRWVARYRDLPYCMVEEE